MSTKANEATGWSTAGSGQSAETSPAELCALASHAGQLRRIRGRRFAALGAVETWHRKAAARFVTALVVAVAILIAISAVAAIAASML